MVFRDLQFSNVLCILVDLVTALAVSLNMCSGISVSDSQLVKVWLTRLSLLDLNLKYLNVGAFLRLLQPLKIAMIDAPELVKFLNMSSSRYSKDSQFWNAQ